MGVNNIINNNSNIISMFIGDVIVEKVYFGDVLIYAIGDDFFIFPLVFDNDITF